jgi:alpha-L-rhamnosidase
MQRVRCKAYVVRGGRAAYNLVRVTQVVASTQRLQYLLLFLLLAGPGALQAQDGASLEQVHRNWHAGWVTHPAMSAREPVVLHFRKELELKQVPKDFVVRVSADNHFTLYVNGSRMGDGPARGDLTHWRYERFNLAPMLRPGKNVIAATVWNFGVYSPTAQMSDRTAFLLESEAEGDEAVSTPKDWLVEREQGQNPLPRRPGDFWEQMLSGPGEEFSADRYDWTWNAVETDKRKWVPVVSAMQEWMSPGASSAKSADADRDNPWGLVPDRLPPMEYTPDSVGGVIRSDLRDASEFPAKPVTIPAKSHVHLLLDRKELTTAYPMLDVSGGRGSHVRLVYAEALYDKDHRKGDRDEVKDRVAAGMTDVFLPDGGRNRAFQPLWWRTWRYLDLDIETGPEPLTLNALKAWFTAYPFQERASFHASDTDLDEIWKISWRTARTGAHDIYADSPYYEQLQYVGDSRIESLISYAVTGDDRLARQAIGAFNDSRIPDGLTQSRYPSSELQVIPTFSLLWIGMVHDFWMYRPDAGQVRAWLPGTRTVLDWFATHEQNDGLLDHLPWWSFVDWVPSGEIPNYDSHGESCTTSLEYLGALNDGADLEKEVGDAEIADRYTQRAARIRTGIFEKCWDTSRGLLADNPDRKTYSQQTNILAVLYDVVPASQRASVMKKLMTIMPGDVDSAGVLSASYYFRFYMARALEHAGLANEYVDSLSPWRKLLDKHFSTWPEIPGNSRSDSHAWSAHPMYDLLTLVAGIEPASPGFASVRIAPHLGTLSSLTVSYPHSLGVIHVAYQTRDGSLHAHIELPAGLEGVFLFNDRKWTLHSGVNEVEAK